MRKIREKFERKEIAAGTQKLLSGGKTILRDE
jgi:hypothetical protein